MRTYADDLRAARDGAARELAQLEAAAAANPQAAFCMTYTIGSQTYDFNGFRAALLSTIERLNPLIVQADPVDVVSVVRGG